MIKKKVDIVKKSLSAHKKLKGKISVINKVNIKNSSDLSVYYTPGVGAVSDYLAKNKNQTKEYTIKSNSVAVISDGSAVLGLGNLGPEGSIPVMEGKCQLFKSFGGIDAWPIVLNTQDVDEIVKTVKNIAPVFGGINLEDISAPRCFEIEERLSRELDIPVIHDDQLGTSMVILAGLINALKVANKKIVDTKVVIVGAGAAGIATAKLLSQKKFKDLILVDSKGIISKTRKDLNSEKTKILEVTNKQNLSGSLDEATIGADIIIGLSKAGAFKKFHIKNMNEKPIVFAMANPVPEIDPGEAISAGAFIVATGRSDFPNQINNVLGFPGIFRGALDNKVKKITLPMILKASENLASIVKKPSKNCIIPSVFDKNVIKAVSKAII